MRFPTFWRRYYRIGERVSPGGPIPPTPALPSGRFDLVVSTGPATAAANIALARRLKAKNVYFGFPQWPVTGAFSLMLSPALGRPRRNVAYALRPSELDASALPAPRPLVDDGVPRRACLLFGGDTKHYRYTVADLELLARRLAAVARDAAVAALDRSSIRGARRWRRSSASPKFWPAEQAPVRVVRFDTGGLLSNLAAFESDLLLVTADSMSMISEGIAAGRPTGILSADAYKAPRRDAEELAYLVAGRRAYSLRFSEIDAAAILSAVPSLKLMRESQLDALHATLVRFGI